MKAILTRNLKDFARSPLRAYTPKQWLAMVEAHQAMTASPESRPAWQATA